MIISHVGLGPTSKNKIRLDLTVCVEFCEDTFFGSDAWLTYTCEALSKYLISLNIFCKVSLKTSIF